MFHFVVKKKSSKDSISLELPGAMTPVCRAALGKKGPEEMGPRDRM